MSVNKKHQANKAVALVQKIKEVAGKLAKAATEDDNMKKFCFDDAITNKAKCVESAKKKCIAAANEYDNLCEQLESAKARVDDLNSNYKSILEENKSLRKSVESIKCGGPVDVKGANNSKLKLNLYKSITGVHFDLNAPDSELTGYVAIRKDSHHHSALAPFMLKKNEPDISILLWRTIGEALKTIESDLPDASVLQTAKSN